MRSAKIQISLRIREVLSESLLGAFWIIKDTKFLHAITKTCLYNFDPLNPTFI